MRAWILLGSLTAAVGAAACGTQAASPFTATDATGQTMVRCAPGQHAVVNQTVVSGRTVAAVDCLSDALAQAPAAYQPGPVSRPAALRTTAPVTAPSTETVAERKATRSWQERAIVIGGSSGAGAGIGALIGGKKGALIGAAIGGGGGTVYEMTRR